jgi:ribosomal protein S18 acetylase RimI-like enzyme
MEESTNTTRQLWEMDAKNVVPLIIKLAEYQKTEGVITPDEDTLANDLGANGMLHGLGSFNEQGFLEGFCISYDIYSTNKTEHSCFLLDLYVDDSARRKGIAKALMIALARNCQVRSERTAGFTYIHLHVLDWNKSAVRFYQTMGAGEVARIYKEREVWIEMKIPVKNLL